MQPNCPAFVINCLPCSGREAGIKKIPALFLVFRLEVNEMVFLGVSPIVLISSNCS